MISYSFVDCNSWQVSTRPGDTHSSRWIELAAPVGGSVAVVRFLARSVQSERTRRCLHRPVRFWRIAPARIGRLDDRNAGAGTRCSKVKSKTMFFHWKVKQNESLYSLIESSRREGGLNRADSWTETFHSFEEVRESLLSNYRNMRREWGELQFD